LSRVQEVKSRQQQEIDQEKEKLTQKMENASEKREKYINDIIQKAHEDVSHAKEVHDKVKEHKMTGQSF